jgi:hypothetical protein
MSFPQRTRVDRCDLSAIRRRNFYRRRGRVCSRVVSRCGHLRYTRGPIGNTESLGRQIVDVGPSDNVGFVCRSKALCHW